MIVIVVSDGDRVVVAWSVPVPITRVVPVRSIGPPAIVADFCCGIP